jgi:AraC family transcriptional regulator, regulatory protein of adaptative response / methylated-DNA-[protein]-cysteine methyltransferase
MNRDESIISTNDDQRWLAVESRNVQADSTFVYAVRTTGIFCRPTCRSRRPNRANVAFFDDGEAAERAGYRACKKCEPTASPSEVGPAKAIARACSKIESSIEIPSLAELADEAGLSVSYFQRLFKRTLGVTPKEFAMSLRTQRLRDGLLGGEKTVAGAIFGAGFGSMARAYEASSEGLGMTPGEYRKGAEGQSIRYASAESSLGWVLVAATDRGLCSIELGDSPEDLANRLVERFPNAQLAGDDPAFAEQLRQVVAMVEAPGRGLDLPLDVRGTAFQRLVWDALRTIPVGSTATYAEVAQTIGRPSAVRAVARACASNELAVVIPCHRVIRGDGGLGGYRWGIDRKRALLDGEKKE